MTQPITKYEISDGFWCFEQDIVRSFLIVGDDSALVIDALFGGDLLSEIRSITDKELRFVLTHADKDHLGCISQFEHVYAHPADFYRLNSQRMYPGFPEPLWEGDVIDLGNYRFETVLLPGHTQGCIALFDAVHRFMIIGDVVQTGPVFMFGDGRDMPSYNASIKKLMGFEGKVDYFISSHHDLKVPFDILPEVEDFSRDIMNGIIPSESTPGPAFLRDSVRCYSKGRASFLLEV